MAEMAYKINKSGVDKFLQRHREFRKFILGFSYGTLAGMGALYLALSLLAALGNWQ